MGNDRLEREATGSCEVDGGLVVAEQCRPRVVEREFFVVELVVGQTFVASGKRSEDDDFAADTDQLNRCGQGFFCSDSFDNQVRATAVGQRCEYRFRLVRCRSRGGALVGSQVTLPRRAGHSHDCQSEIVE